MSEPIATNSLIAEILVKVSEFTHDLASFVCSKTGTTFTPAYLTPVTTNKKKEKPPRDPTKPKRPLSAYMLFMADRRKQSPEANLKFAEIATEWHNLDEKKKNKYVKQAEKLHETYDAEIAKWSAGNLKEVPALHATPESDSDTEAEDMVTPSTAKAVEQAKRVASPEKENAAKKSRKK